MNLLWFTSQFLTASMSRTQSSSHVESMNEKVQTDVVSTPANRTDWRMKPSLTWFFSLSGWWSILIIYWNRTVIPHYKVTFFKSEYPNIRVIMQNKPSWCALDQYHRCVECISADGVSDKPEPVLFVQSETVRLKNNSYCAFKTKTRS